MAPVDVRSVAVASVLYGASAAAGQQPAVVPEAGLWLGPTLSAGAGPSLTATAGLSIAYQLSTPVRLRAEIAVSDQGLAPCEQQWPDSYRCDMNPLELLVGIGMATLLSQRSSLGVDVLGGVHTLERDLDGAAPAVRVSAELARRLGQGWSAGVVAYWGIAFSRDYRSLFPGELPEYRIVGITIRYRLSGR